ncbi:hypothetical protein E2C01_024107 [Portunus trituberculatus]|uniref:Chitin-binding type-2 domain-containing protein n=1 Tax=Portunus trituberculatus TaxID=210409 RepID=A0A5B7EB17_PORTR|nr:hypothetical protein [Portunus trituberculatus]
MKQGNTSEYQTDNRLDQETFNRRYPDYIVDPRVNCTSEGVFPHPRNCSWYYRCVDYMNMGFYRTYYFECEPGTQFADELDQCVFPSNNRPPCRSDNGHGTSVIYLSCTFKECRQYIPCDGSRSLCKGCYNDNVFPPPTYNFCRHPGQVFDKRKGSCVPQPPENELCYDQMLLPLMEEQPATDGSVSAFPYPISWPSTTTVRPSIAMIDMSVFGITCSEEKRNHFEKELLWDQCRAYCFSMGHLHVIFSTTGDTSSSRVSNELYIINEKRIKRTGYIVWAEMAVVVDKSGQCEG